MIDLTPLLGRQTVSGQPVDFRVFSRDGTERWLIEAHYRQPWHLETWPRANWRAQVIYRLARLLGVVGLHLPSQRVTLTIAEGSPYAQFRDRFKALGVFLGTPGPNRKFVVFAKDGNSAWFIKVPISPSSAALARAEAAALEALADDAQLAERLPSHHWIGDALALEDIRASGANYASLDDDEIIRVHQLLFARSQSEVAVQDLVTSWTQEVPPAPPHPDEELRALISSARRAAHGFLASLDPALRVECYLAHGDFTRWNVLRAPDGTARIIDWELFARRTKFFDAFHYLVSQAILVDRTPPGEIVAQVVRFGSRMAAPDMVLRYFGLYLAEQTLVHCDLYERSDHVFPQIFWNLQIWTEMFALLSSHRARPGSPLRPGQLDQERAQH